MFKTFQRMPYDRYKQILTVILIAFLTGGIILFWVNSSIVEKGTVAATQQQMLVLAKAGARSVESLLSMFKTELVILADREEIKSFDLPEARKLMSETTLSADQPIVKQLGLISKEGILLITANREGKTENEGNSLADRNFFQWAKTAQKGEVFLSEPIIGRSGINKDQWVIVLATPIIQKNGFFNGVLYAPIRLEDLTIKYLETLKISPTTAAYVINKDGMAVSSPFKALIGINVREYAKEKKWKGYETYLEQVEAMTKGEEGTRVYWFMGTDEIPRKWVSGFAPVKLNKYVMTIAVATRYEEAYNLFRDFFENQVIWLVFTVLVGITAAFFLIIGIHLSKQDGYKLGLKDGAKFERNGRGKKSS